MRNVENARWAVTIVLPNGRRHFPDFVIGVDGRKTADHIALVETKDNGETGRLFAKANTDKVRTDHSVYGSLSWSFVTPTAAGEDRLQRQSACICRRDLFLSASGWLRGVPSTIMVAGWYKVHSCPDGAGLYFKLGIPKAGQRDGLVFRETSIKSAMVPMRGR